MTKGRFIGKGEQLEPRLFGSCQTFHCVLELGQGLVLLQQLLAGFLLDGDFEL